MVEHLVDVTSSSKKGRWPQHLNWAINRVFYHSTVGLESELSILINGCSYLHDEKYQKKIEEIYWWKLPKYWTKRDVVRLIFMAQAESWQSFYGEDGFTRLLAKRYYEKAEVPPEGESDEAAKKILNKYATNLKTAYSDYSPWVYCVKAIVRLLQGELER